MPKYKVGDVAALFPKPKESTTETGKKLQSLFSAFHIKGNKSLPQSPQEHVQPKRKAIKKQNEATESQSNSMKVRKRKFSEELDLSSLESNVNKILKKFKPTDEVEETKSPKIKKNKGRNTLSTEIDFPRRKNKSKKFNFDIFQSNKIPDSDVTENSSQKPSFAPKKVFKFNSSENSKQSKCQNIQKNNKSPCIENSDQKPLYTNDSSVTLFKTEKQKQKIKKAKKKKWENASSDAQNSDFKRTSQAKASNQKETDSKMNADNSHAQNSDFKRTSQAKASNEEETDSKMNTDNSYVRKSKKKLKLNIRDKETKEPDSEEVLSRTLFVGNLPTNTTGKALKNFFSTFGLVDYVRYRPIETDRKKIFKQGGPKEQNLHYAAESVPGFVVFKERQNAMDALVSSGSLFENRHITVDFAMAPGSKKLYDNKRSVFIGNLPFDIQDETVWNAFAECGKIDSVRIVRDRSTGIGKGFGYIQFSNVQAKETALALENLEIEGRSIRIKAVETNQRMQKKASNTTPLKRDPFKSRAINFKKSHKDTGSRKTVKKIMKKQKDMHKKKKIASFMQNSMK